MGSGDETSVDVPLGAVDGPTLSLGASVAASGDADAYGGKKWIQ